MFATKSIITRIKPFLDKKFFVLVTIEANQIGIDKPSNIEAFAKAAFWQG